MSAPVSFPEISTAGITEPIIAFFSLLRYKSYGF